MSLQDLFGGESSSSGLPQWATEAAQDHLKGAKERASLGYMPYYGPQVAAMPSGILDAINSDARAYGMDEVKNTLPTPDSEYGYSTGGLLDQAIEQFKSKRPGQYEAYMAQFVDPYKSGGGEQPAPDPNAGAAGFFAGVKEDGDMAFIPALGRWVGINELRRMKANMGVK